ncbi:hypothetical protein PIROE2DRAFT_8051, partial [Piromyces sp. E2]
KSLNIFACAITLIFAALASASSIKYVGFNYTPKNIKESFGKIPDPATIVKYVNIMKNKVEEEAKAVLFVTVGELVKNKICAFNFPKPKNVENLSNVSYGKEDMFENLLSKCDEEKINVWLVVEPGDNDLIKLSNIVIEKYKKHKSVKGFGADLNLWYSTTNESGKVLTDQEAKDVVTNLRNTNRRYTFLAKHRFEHHLPQYYDGGMIFVCNEQGYVRSSKMCIEAAYWSSDFPYTKIIFESGHEKDENMWSKNPLGVINEVFNCGNDYNDQIGFVWDDKSMKKVIDIINKN